MDTFYTILQSAHSGFRWIVLMILIATTVVYLIKGIKRSRYTSFDKKLFTVNLSLIHLQVLGGIILYFLSPKILFSESTMSVRLIRFFTVEHSIMMLLVAALVTIASSKIKKKESDTAKFKTGFWYNLIALILILVAIPWPFQGLGAGWF